MSNEFKNYNILVTGSNGQVGSEFKMLNDEFLMLNCKCFFTDKSELDITDKLKIKEFIERNNIKIIINCAAYTAVDKAEEKKELADLINHKAVKYLAEISKEKDIFMIHISTDYVFDGKNYKPYTEDDQTNPQNVYGITKLKGEQAFINTKARGIIIRTSWLYGSHGNNFVKTMLRLSKQRKEIGVIFDQVGSPTYAADLAKTILQIIQHSTFNIQHSIKVYHYSNEGVCSWYDFAKAIFEIKGIDIKINPIETKEYSTPAIRPHYSLLNKAKIKEELDILVPYWKESLEQMLNYEF